jgi:hypothetical protein
MKKIFSMVLLVLFASVIGACQTTLLQTTTTSSLLSSTSETTISSTTLPTTNTPTTQSTSPTTILTTSSTTLLPTTSTTTMTSTQPTLSSVSGIQIEGSIITFESVPSATKYRLYVYDTQDQLVKEFFVSSGFDLLLLLEPGTYRFSIKATAPGFNDSSITYPLEQAIFDKNAVSVLSEELLNDPTKIRFIGRTYYNDQDATRFFFFTASGFEVTFYGTELKAIFKASNSSNLSKQAYLVVFIDGEEDPTKGTTIVLNQNIEEYTLVSGLPEGFHTVKVLKRSEAIDSNTSLMQLSTDGIFSTPPLAKNFRIQYIAASSSTGYGNLGSSSVSKSSANSHGLLAFAYLTSYLLDAETSIFSSSGWGVSRGYNTGGAINETQNIPAAYQYFAINDANTVFTTPGTWNHSDYVPDVVVVNLGTNDFNSSGYNSMNTEQKAALVSRFIADYSAFLVLLNNQYPNAVIIVAYGLMGEASTLGGFTNQAIQLANQTIGETVCVPFQMEAAGTAPNPYGSNYHPNVGTSMNVAQALATLIHTLTGREITREMITYPA